MAINCFAKVMMVPISKCVINTDVSGNFWSRGVGKSILSITTVEEPVQSHGEGKEKTQNGLLKTRSVGVG
jgi:hypothetical protein